jgi:uncharacterized damage-inducible protein DinB
MTLTTLLLEELEREAERSRRALEFMPEGKHEWKPHESSMAFGYLANLVATIPTWVDMIVNTPEIDINPKDRPRPQIQPMTSAQLIAALDEALAKARTALASTTDEHLATNWRILAAGQVQAETPRRVVISDTINHWVHHRGQMTVYLRLLGAKVPATYGPSKDDQRFM